MDENNKLWLSIVVVAQCTLYTFSSLLGLMARDNDQNDDVQEEMREEEAALYFTCSLMYESKSTEHKTV